MSKYDSPTAVAVVGLASFQLWNAWNQSAPTLADARKAPAGDCEIKQQLVDADFMVGGLAVIIGVTFALMTHDLTVLLIMLGVFGSLSIWHHMVLAADSR